MKTSIKTVLSLVAVSLLSGCGSSDSSTPSSTSVDSGQFIDSVVTGLAYDCSSGASGVTDLFGRFKCEVGDTISFNINGFDVGSSALAATITPRTLYPNDDAAAINLAQLLQTIDSDANAQNGIQIDNGSFAVQALSTANVALDQVDFDSAIVTHIGLNLVDEVSAATHMDESIQNISNSSLGLTELSTVVVMNGIDEAFCANLQNSHTQTYQGFTDYADFVSQGGSHSIDHFTSTQSCGAYSAAGFCIEQEYTQILGGTGSCVQTIIFPFVPTASTDGTDTNVTEPVDTGTTDTTLPTPVDTMSYSTYNTVYKPLMPNLRNDNIHFNGTDYTVNSDITLQYYLTVPKAKIADTLYFIGGNPLYGYEVYTDTYTSTTLNTQYYDSQTNYLGNQGDWNINVVDNIHSKEGSAISTRFSKAIASDTLHQMYMEQGLDIVFEVGDEGQFMLSSDESTYAYISLALNESAYLKVVEAFEGYTVPVP